MLALVFVFALVGSAFALDISEFREWAIKHEKSYLSDNVELQRRYTIFQENLQRIAKLNSQNTGVKHVLNKFSDLTQEEFTQKYLAPDTLNHAQALYSQLPVVTGPLPPAPASFDWRDKGAVTRVKNQLSCGSCWAFSAIANIEGQWFLAGHPIQEWSEQQLVDCDKECMQYMDQNVCDNGCRGGLMPNAFSYAIKNKIQTEEDYPYTGRKGWFCRASSSKGIFQGKNLTVVAKNETVIRDYLVSQGPLSIAVQADTWQSYGGGVLDDVSCAQKLNHGVTLVGYGTDAQTGKDFWFIKNSWNTDWGENGYIRIARGKNMCGVQEFACSITL